MDFLFLTASDFPGQVSLFHRFIVLFFETIPQGYLRAVVAGLSKNKRGLRDANHTNAGR
jgi:hypothetical protein